MKTVPGRMAAVLEKAPTSREEDRRAAMMSSTIAIGTGGEGQSNFAMYSWSCGRSIDRKKCRSVSSDRAELSISAVGGVSKDSRRHVLERQTFLGYGSLRWNLRLASGQSEARHCQLRLRCSRNRQERAREGT